MRCPDCGKFVSLEEQEPEVNNLEVGEPDENGVVQVTGEVRCVLTCVDCGTELKEANFEICEDIDLEEDDRGHPGAKHEPEIEEVNMDATESGGSRYKKNNRGYHLDWKITCHVEHCGLEREGYFEDSIPASQWDELV